MARIAIRVVQMGLHADQMAYLDVNGNKTKTLSLLITLVILIITLRIGVFFIPQQKINLTDQRNTAG